MTTARWYDSDSGLKSALEMLKTLHADEVSRITSGITQIINNAGKAGLIDSSAPDFPLDPYRRRWYDKDPYLWLVINGLSMADTALLNEVKTYLNQEINT